MQIMCSANKLSMLFSALALNMLIIGHVVASDLAWVKGSGGQILLELSDGAFRGLSLPSNVTSVIYDKERHQVKGDSYISLFQVSPSNVGEPAGVCGAGSEVWLYVYKEVGQVLDERERVLVSSCLRSISLVSQNSGKESQDFDFSSVQWSGQGFLIEWFQQAATSGQPLSSTSYVLDNDVFLRHDVLREEKQPK